MYVCEPGAPLWVLWYWGYRGSEQPCGCWSRTHSGVLGRQEVLLTTAEPSLQPSFLPHLFACFVFVWDKFSDPQDGPGLAISLPASHSLGWDYRYVRIFTGLELTVTEDDLGLWSCPYLLVLGWQAVCTKPGLFGAEDPGVGCVHAHQARYQLSRIPSHSLLCIVTVRYVKEMTYL